MNSVVIREFRPSDTNFVISTWLRSYYSLQTGYKAKFDTFFNEHQKIIKKLWAQKDLVCLVAVDHEDDDLIIGFAVFGTDYSLHYVCVKETFKRLGVATKLLDSMLKNRPELIVSHWTKDLSYFKNKYKLKYNPYKFFK